MKYLVVPQNWFGIFMIFLWFWRILQYLCFYRKREKRKKKKRACIGLVQPTMKPAQLQGFNPGGKRSPPGEAHSDLDILHQEPDIFQKLLRPSHLFFLSSIFTSGTPYFFIFSSLLLISVGNETEIETEPVIGRGWGRKKIRRKFCLFIIRYKFQIGSWCIHIGGKPQHTSGT